MSNGETPGLIQERIEPEDVQYKRFTIPLVRRIYPQLWAKKVLSVQPLLGPTGLMYYERFRYSSNKGLEESPQAEKPFKNQVTIEEIDS